MIEIELTETPSKSASLDMPRTIALLGPSFSSVRLTEEAERDQLGDGLIVPDQRSMITGAPVPLDSIDKPNVVVVLAVFHNQT